MHGHLIFAVSESPYCWKPSTKFLLKMIYGLEEDVGRRVPRCLFSAWPSLMSEWGAFSYSESLSCRKPSIKLFLKRIYGLEEMFKEQQDSC